MLTALHTRATVQSGGKIEVTDLRLAAGESVEIFVVRIPSANEERVSALDVLAQTPRVQCFKTVTEVDQFVAEERNAWEH